MLGLLKSQAPQSTVITMSWLNISICILFLLFFFMFFLKLLQTVTKEALLIGRRSRCYCLYSQILLALMVLA